MPNELLCHLCPIVSGAISTFLWFSLMKKIDMVDMEKDTGGFTNTHFKMDLVYRMDMEKG